jgi:Icc-related predicted phosphoesterase
VFKLRILAAADFHGIPDATTNLLRFLERSYDCLLLIGDLTNFGPLSAAEDILNNVESTGLPTLAVPGNCDPKSILEILDNHGVNLHARVNSIDGVTFVGLGGSNLTPFNTPFELTEAEIKEELDDLVNGLDQNFILVTHAPPYGTLVDRTHDGIHAGSKSIREFIEEREPIVAVCGHIHESRNTDKLGHTTIVNPGPIVKGYAADIEVAGNRATVKLLEI